MLSGGWAVVHTIQAAVGEAALNGLCCAFSPDRADSKSVCTALHGNTLKLFDIETGDRLTLKDGVSVDVVSCCAFSPDGSIVVSGSSDTSLQLWEIKDGVNFDMLQGHNEAFSPEGHTAAVLCCAFSPDGRSICSGSNNKSLKLWDATKFECERTLYGHGTIYCCAFSADSATVLSGSDDETLKLWSVATGECIRTFTGHNSTVAACYFSPSDGSILSGSWDSTLKLWDATTAVAR